VSGVLEAEGEEVVVVVVEVAKTTAGKTARILIGAVPAKKILAMDFPSGSITRQ
jgi:hypothetical protein